MPDQEDIIGALMEAAPVVLRRDYNPDSCILATRMAIEALDAFGVRARPMSVQLLVFNSEARELLERGLTQDELAERMRGVPKDQPGGPWVIGVDQSRPARDGRFNGHLVTRVGDSLVDLTLPQVNRPHKGIELDPVVLELGEPWATDGIASFVDDGVLVGYHQVEDDDQLWRSANDWTWPVRGSDSLPRRALHRANTGEIVRAMRAELGANA